MKKITSYILSFMVIFVMALSVPLMVGCARTYTVDVSIVGGNRNGGWVLHGDSYAESAYGKTSISEGENFDVHISPFDGYVISQIKINGENYDKTFNPTGYDLVLTIEEDTTIEVAFEKYEYTFKLECATYNKEGFTGFVEYTGYSLHAKVGDRIYLEAFDPEKLPDGTYMKDTYLEKDGVFFYTNSRSERIYVSATTGFVVKSGSYVFRTFLTKEELDELIRPVYNVTITDATVYESGDAEAPYGTISVVGAEGNVDGIDTFEVKQGQQFVFNITAKAGYTVEKLEINGKHYTGFTSGSDSYSFSAEIEEVTEYKVYFKKIAE